MANPEWPDEVWQKCLRLKRQGLNNHEIAAELGVSREAVMGKLWRKGVSAAPGVARLEKPPEAREPRVRVRAGKVTLPPLPSLETADAGS
jgi:hypothetical protein